MIQLVTSENRSAFFRELTEMHRQRKVLFVDQMHWNIQCEEGLEIDEFDGPDALYLLHFDGAGALNASARMLRTDRPHLLSSYFADLCPGGVPRGEAVWESTRFCPSPLINSAEERRRLLGTMIAGMMEAALLFGVDQITFVASGALKPCALSAGWDAQPLGPMRRIQGDRVTACLAQVNPQGLRRVRDRHALNQPLIRYSPVRRAA